jgi:ribose 5-phosphate isomerase B
MGKARIGIGSDHAAWHLKEEIIDILGGEGYPVRDYSLDSPDSVDYPDIANHLAADVGKGKIGRGILICGTGLGMAIAANRHPGVRATPCYDSYTARMSREHNNSNVLVLGGRVTGPELAFEIVRIWLAARFKRGRHARRLAKIKGGN